MYEKKKSVDNIKRGDRIDVDYSSTLSPETVVNAKPIGFYSKKQII